MKQPILGEYDISEAGVRHLPTDECFVPYPGGARGRLLARRSRQRCRKLRPRSGARVGSEALGEALTGKNGLVGSDLQKSAFAP